MQQHITPPATAAAQAAAAPLTLHQVMCLLVTLHNGDMPRGQLGHLPNPDLAIILAIAATHLSPNLTYSLYDLEAMDHNGTVVPTDQQLAAINAHPLVPVCAWSPPGTREATSYGDLKLIATPVGLGLQVTSGGCALSSAYVYWIMPTGTV